MKKYFLVLLLVCGLTKSFAQQNLKSSQYVSLKSTIELKGNGYTPVYKVPKDSCFVVTDVFVYEPMTTPMSHFIYENELVALRVINGEWLNLTTGILFKSGSEVNFKNSRALKNDYSYYISGYLIKQE